MSEQDLISIITGDHRAVEAVFAELEAGTDNPQHRKDLVDHVIAELVRHSIAEEQFMYPAARQYLDDGGTIVDHELEEHSGAEQVMKDLERLDVHEPLFDATLAELMRDIRHHIKDEEQDLLPKLQAACTTVELEKLGGQVLAAKEVAPTRPHPSLPNTPPANRIVGPGVGLVDTIRDVLTRRAT